MLWVNWGKQFLTMMAHTLQYAFQSYEIIDVLTNICFSRTTALKWTLLIGQGWMVTRCVILTLNQVLANTGHIPNSGQRMPTYSCCVVIIYYLSNIYGEILWIFNLRPCNSSLAWFESFLSDDLKYNENISFLCLMLDNMRYGPRCLSYLCMYVVISVPNRLGLHYKITVCWNSLCFVVVLVFLKNTS